MLLTQYTLYSNYSNRTFLLKDVVDVGILLWPGIALMLAGMGLHARASSLIGIKGTFGWTELFPPKKSRFVVAGPYKYARHLIYLVHTLMFSGVFFMTDVVSTAVVAVLDFLVSYFVIAPLEEKELRERFGKEYEEYAKRVGKFLPAKF